MQTDRLTPAQESFLRMRELERTFAGYTAAEISTMDPGEFARLSGRELVFTPTAPVPERVPEQAPEAVPEPVPEARGVTVAEMSPAQYAQARGRLGMGQSHEYGRGILDGTAPDAWAKAAASKAGRNALVTSNVTEAPRLTGRTVLRQDDLRDNRTAAKRFSTPGNANTF